MAAENTKFATQDRAMLESNLSGVARRRQSGGLGNRPSPAFLFFKPYRIQPGIRTGHRLRSGSLFVVISAFAHKAVNSRALALY